MSTSTTDQRATEVVSTQKKFTFHYVKPNSANDLKREGRTLKIRNNEQRRWFTLTGREINSLKKMLRDVGELD